MNKKKFVNTKRLCDIAEETAVIALFLFWTLGAGIVSIFKGNDRVKQTSQSNIQNQR